MYIFFPLMTFFQWCRNLCWKKNLVVLFSFLTFRPVSKEEFIFPPLPLFPSPSSFACCCFLSLLFLQLLSLCCIFTSPLSPPFFLPLARLTGNTTKLFFFSIFLRQSSSPKWKICGPADQPWTEFKWTRVPPFPYSVQGGYTPTF